MLKSPLIVCLTLLLTPFATLASEFPVQRCVNLSNALDGPFEGAWGYTIKDSHIAAIAADGFDTIRLPVRFQAGYTDGRINPAMLDRVDHVIQVALAHDLLVVLDFHHFFELMEDPDAHGDLFVAIWEELSRHYTGWPETLMFELLNEPERNLTTVRADALYDRVFPILRAAHPHRWIIVGGGNWSSRNSLADLAPRDDRTAYTFHFYDPFGFTHQTAEWVNPAPPKRGPTTEAERAQVRADFEALQDFPVPLFLGEFGAYNVVAPDERASWMATVRRASQAAGIGWCHWGYASGFRITEDDLTWIPGLRDALLLP